MVYYNTKNIPYYRINSYDNSSYNNTESSAVGTNKEVTNMNISINTDLASYKREVKNSKDLIDLVIEIKNKFSAEDNEWED